MKQRAWQLLIGPLQSRKVRTAITTVIVAYLSEAGLNVPDEIVLAIVGVGVARILGIAIEDAAALNAGTHKTQQDSEATEL